ncbi:ABC transporter ATP-binding protein [Metaclostridioides mangenotii]|uniref:ABC transporter ATP-binding protein n=1 Tax=Metaclostridioides mangenotii TaxID=1540 RepID=UPI000467441F|nr:ABC transporter ATP-binding protein [Clostridioides mangenotii]
MNSIRVDKGYVAEFKNLQKNYGKKEALKNINLNIPRGKIVGLLGPNGSGKSTMIKILNGLLHPDSGEILIEGMKPSIETRSIVSYLPERTYLNDWMKVKDIIKFFSDFYSDFDIDKAIKMLKDLNIDTEEKLKTMSKGTKEKVQLILVMSRKAELYILDEPIGGVDPAARSYILKTILQNYNEDSTLLIATHLISEIENICDEIIFLSYGDIVLQGNVEEIKEEKGKSIDALFREEFKC